MWDRIRNGTFLARKQTIGTQVQSSRRAGRRPSVEVLENRDLMTASLAPITNFSIPSQLGFQLPLDGSGSNASKQTFTVTSSNPNIKVSVAQGQFWTVTVSHNSSGSNDPQINNETMTFQLFQDLTPQTVSRITNLTNQNYYTQGFPNENPPVAAGQYIPRITSVSSSGFAAVQGGSSSPTSTASSSGIPPIATEPVQQLAFTGQAQLAMANTGQPNSTDAQFFITSATLSTSTQQAFDFNYSLFGQLVSGQSTLTKLSQVAVTTPPGNPSGEKSVPVNPVVINAVSLSDDNPNGVLHIDTTGVKAGETATITVTATDPSDNSTASQSFTVTTTAYNGPSNPVINFVPFASAVSSSTTSGQPLTVQLSGTSGFPNTSTPGTLSYSLLSQPTHGTVSNFNATNGTLTYTPDTGYTGPDSFQYQVIATGPQSSPATTTSLPATVSITVGTAPPAPPVNTGAVRLVNNVLVVTPPTRGRKVTDSIHVSQETDAAVTGGERIVVSVNGATDIIQPASSSLLQIVVFGTKANQNIVVDSDVTVPTTLDGGHGGRNVIRGGGGTTRAHGWFGHTVLVGGTGSNQLIGRRGVARFRPSDATTLAFLGEPKARGKNSRTVPPGGTYYRYVHGRLVPVLSF